MLKDTFKQTASIFNGLPGFNLRKGSSHENVDNSVTLNMAAVFLKKKHEDFILENSRFRMLSIRSDQGSCGDP